MVYQLDLVTLTQDRTIQEVPYRIDLDLKLPQEVGALQPQIQPQ